MHQWQRRPDLPDSPVAARVKLLFEFKDKLSASRDRTFFEALFDQVTEGLMALALELDSVDRAAFHCQV